MWPHRLVLAQLGLAAWRAAPLLPLENQRLVGVRTAKCSPGSTVRVSDVTAAVGPAGWAERLLQREKSREVMKAVSLQPRPEGSVEPLLVPGRGRGCVVVVRAGGAGEEGTAWLGQ